MSDEKLDPRVDDNAQKIKELELEIYDLKKWKEGHIDYHKQFVPDKTDEEED